MTTNHLFKLIFKDKRWWFMLACTLAVVIFVFKLASLKAYAVSNIDPLRYLDYYPDSLCRQFDFHVGNKGLNNAGVNGYQWSISDNFFVAYYNKDTITVYSVSRYAVTPSLAIIRNQYDDSIFHIGKSSVLSTGSFNYNDVTTIYYGAYATYNVSETAYYNIPTISGSSFTSALTQYLNGYFYRCKNNSVFYTILDGNEGFSDNLEQLISDGNTIASNNATNVATITSDVNDIKQNGLSSSGLDDATKLLFERYDKWLVIIMFAVVLTLIRNIIHGIGRNVRL